MSEYGGRGNGGVFSRGGAEIAERTEDGFGSITTTTTRTRTIGKGSILDFEL